MLLADSNIWLALALSKHEFHTTVRSWFVRQKPGTRMLFCRMTQMSFLRLLTTAAIMAPYGIPPLSNRAAWAAFERFLTDERIDWADEPRGLESQWKKFAGGPRPSPKLWMDAYLAAFAIADGHQLVTTDQAFRQFKGLDVVILTRS